MASSSNSNVRWSEEATEALIALFSDESIQLSLEASKTSKETSKIYKTLLAHLQNKGFCEGFCVKDVTNKMKKLKQKYKSEKDKKRRSGTSRAKEWKFFQKMDEFMCKKHIVAPPLIVDTMAERSESEQEDDDSVAELKEKYGDGDQQVRKCDTCDYEQVIHSAGVHVSEGGAIKVYADADVFSCPNCEKDKVNEAFDQKEDAGNVATKKDLIGANPQYVDQPLKESKLPAATKKKRKTTVEKSLDVVFQKFQEASETDFLRLQKLEDDKIRREHEFHLRQTVLENNRRREEREHEMRMLRMMMGYPPEACTPVYTNLTQQQSIRTNNHSPFECNDPYLSYSDNSSSSSFSCHGANSTTSTDQSNSYFVL